jgi:hypothetical protein
LKCQLTALLVARRRPASPDGCLRWLSVWLPEIRLASLIDYPGSRIVRAPTRLCLAEIIQAFWADALSSTVSLNVDLDVVLHPGPGPAHHVPEPARSDYATATPDTIQRRFLETSGAIINDANTITLILNRRAYSPVLRQSDLHADTAVPGGKAVTSATSSANRRHDSLHENPR